MKKASLTDLKIRKLMPEGSKRVEVWDNILPGFGVRISPSGTKSFVLMYRFNGKLRRNTLGRYPLLSLAQARSKAQGILMTASRGEDPAPKNGERKKVGEVTEGSFGQTLDSFLELHCMRHNKPSTIRSTRRLLEKEFLPEWRVRAVADIRKAEIIHVLDGIVARGAPGAANHAYSAISKFFSWCSERDIVDINPCADIKRPSKLNTRDRILSDDELMRVWRAATEMDYPFGQIARLLILTAQRRGEVTNMRWAHIDMEKGVWEIPKEMTKSNRQHTLPLSPIARSIIGNIPRLHEDLIFPARGSITTVFSGFGKCKKRLEEVSGITDWTLHDLRRTAATNMAGLGVTPHVVEKILNHSSGTISGVAAIYNRFGYLDEMRDALTRWEEKIAALAEK